MSILPVWMESDSIICIYIFTLKVFRAQTIARIKKKFYCLVDDHCIFLQHTTVEQCLSHSFLWSLHVEFMLAVSYGFNCSTTVCIIMPSKKRFLAFIFPLFCVCDFHMTRSFIQFFLPLLVYVKRRDICGELLARRG